MCDDLVNDDFNFYPICIKNMIDKKFPYFNKFIDILHDSILLEDSCIKTFINLHNFIQSGDKICILYSKNPEQSYMHYIYNLLDGDIKKYIEKCYESDTFRGYNKYTTEFKNPLYIIMNECDANVKFVEKNVFDMYFSNFFINVDKINYMREEMPTNIYFIDFNGCTIPIASRGRYFGIINKKMSFIIPKHRDIFTAYPALPLHPQSPCLICLYINKSGFKNDHEICLNINPYNSEEIIKNLCLIEDIKNV